MHAFALRPPKPGTEFVTHRGRLALFHVATAEPTYWHDYWLDDQARAKLHAAARGEVGWDFGVFWNMLARHVPAGSTVLEAGCGLGHAVAALDAHGYRGTGVDYVPALVAFGKATLPALDVVAGDVEALPFADGSFDCYASLGVAEHFEHGPARVLAEGHRVLRPGGFAYIEVPFLNTVRRHHLERLARSPVRADGYAFHQYYFDVAEMTALIERAGFEVVEHATNSWEAVILREHPLISRWWSSRLAFSRVRKPVRELLRALPALGPRYAHMIAFGCRRR